MADPHRLACPAVQRLRTQGGEVSRSRASAKAAGTRDWEVIESRLACDSMSWPCPTIRAIGGES